MLSSQEFQDGCWGVSIRIHWLCLWKLSQVLETGRELSLYWHQVTTVPFPTDSLQVH